MDQICGDRSRQCFPWQSYSWDILSKITGKDRLISLIVVYDTITRFKHTPSEMHLLVSNHKHPILQCTENDRFSIIPVIRTSEMHQSVCCPFLWGDCSLSILRPVFPFPSFPELNVDSQKPDQDDFFQFSIPWMVQTVTFCSFHNLKWNVDM